MKYKDFDDSIPKLDDTHSKKQYSYIEYKGKSYQEFDTEVEAKQYSSLIEKIQTNKEEYDGYWDALRTRENVVFDLWYSELRLTYQEFTDEQFAIVYAMAYDKGHAYGYDEVASYVSDFSYWARQLLDTTVSNAKTR